MITYRGDNLKKILKLNLCLLNIFILILFLCGCNSNDEDKTSIEQKVNTEISYIDSELVSIVNKLNNVNYAKYKVAIEEVKNKTLETGGSQSKSSSNEQNSEGSENSEQQGGSGESQQEEKSSKKNDKKFSMETENILGKETEVNWDELKSKIENLYSSWPVISIDLKEVGVMPEQLTDFSNNLDKVAVAIKNEDEVATIENIINLYSCLPKFIEIYGESKDTNVIYSKCNLLVCYKYAMLEDWENLQNSVSDLKMSFSNVSNKKDEYNGKNINIESAAVIINEMEDSSEVEDKDVFFIKYKNLMEELNIILSI